MRRYLAVVVVVLLAACGGDDEPEAACADWDRIEGTDVSDAEAVEVLNRIADKAEHRPVRDKAVALAVLLEGDATPTEIRVAYQEMDAACEVAG